MHVCGYKLQPLSAAVSLSPHSVKVSSGIWLFYASDEYNHVLLSARASTTAVCHAYTLVYTGSLRIASEDKETRFRLHSF